MVHLGLKLSDCQLQLLFAQTLLLILWVETMGLPNKLLKSKEQVLWFSLKSCVLEAGSFGVHFEHWAWCTILRSCLFLYHFWWISVCLLLGDDDDKSSFIQPVPSPWRCCRKMSKKDWYLILLFRLNKFLTIMGSS